MTIDRKSLPEPILVIIALGEPETIGRWADYTKFGITMEHAPQLHKLMMNMDYHDSYDPVEIWIPLHAWRALAQLGAIFMIQPYAELLSELEDDDWITDDAPRVVEELGPASLSRWFEILDMFEAQGRTECANSLLEGISNIGKRHLESRRYVTDEFSRRLEQYAKFDEGYNGFMIMLLLELHVRKALPTIAAAFADNTVDELVVYWEEVIEAFRLPPSSRPNEYRK